MLHKKSFIVLILIASFFIAVSAQAKEIVVGFTGPFSGPAAEYGYDCVNGVDMAIKEINAGGGITIKGEKHTFKLERLDDRNDPATAVANAKKFRASGAIAVFSPLFAAISEIQKVNQEKGNEFILMAYTSTPKAAQFGNKLIVLLTMPFTPSAQSMADYAWGEKKWRKCATVVTAGAYGDEWKHSFQAYWKKLGGTVVFDKSANYYKEVNFTPILTEAMAAGPDFMLIGGPSATTALVVEQARKAGFKGGFVLIDQAKMDFIAQMQRGTQLLDTALGVGPANANAYPCLPEFEKKYKTAYRKINVSTEVTRNYSGMQALAKAASAAGTASDVAAIRAAFSKALPIMGDKVPSEIYGISPKGRLFTTTSMLVVDKGKMLPVQSILWYPKSQAEFNQIAKQSKSQIKLNWFKVKIDNVD